jgi:hypothetical protein
MISVFYRLKTEAQNICDSLTESAIGSIVRQVSIKESCIAAVNQIEISKGNVYV